MTARAGAPAGGALWLSALLAACQSGVGDNRSALRFEGEAPKHLLMISMDTTRRDAIGRYADGPSLTPFLDRKFEEAVALDDFASCSNWTIASAGCVLSGARDVEAASERGMIPFYAGGKPVPFPGAGHPRGPTPFLATWLGEAGFRSALVTGNPFLGPEGGNDQGYDSVDVLGPGSEVWDRAFQVAPRSKHRFLHVHLMEPHLPYSAPAEYLVGLDALPPLPIDQDLASWDGAWAAAGLVGRNPPVLTPDEIAVVTAHLRVRYEGEIRYADHLLEQAWARLDDEGLLDDTLVVFWTDHGEAFWEHDVFAHANHLFREENDAVAFFWAKNLEPRVVSDPMEGPDLAPTVLEVFGLPRPESMTGSPLGETPPDRIRHAFANTLLGPVHSARQGRYKLVYAWQTGRLHAFDLEADPRERDNLAVGDTLGPEHLALWLAMQPRIEAVAPFVADDPRGWKPN